MTSEKSRPIAAWSDVFISGTGSEVPPVVETEIAIAQGRIERQVAESTDIVSAAVSSMSAPEMASRAARSLSRMYHRDLADVALLIHATAWDQQHLAAPQYIQAALGMCVPMAFELRHGCAGGLTALAVAAQHLVANPADTVLVTAADRFTEPAFDRWRSASGLIHGDGAAAAMLTRGRGFAALRSFAAASAPAYEMTGRTAALMTGGSGETLDAIPTKRRLISTIGRAELVADLAQHTTDTVTAALHAAHLEFRDIDHIVVPHLGRKTLDAFFFTPMAAQWKASTWDFGRTVGHTGPADTLLGLDYLACTGALDPGQHVLAFGIGTGFCWSSAVIEIIDTPATADHRPTEPERAGDLPPSEFQLSSRLIGRLP
ncbi:ketoacyl-ACP synthase III family protein [Nocardia terpenica]|nr:ketoacyl-ACP synthase III family protein [Nocardia terpenica]